MQRGLWTALIDAQIVAKRDLVSTEFAQRLTDGKGLDRN